MRAHDLVAAAPHRVNAGRVEGAAVPFARVVAEPFEHPFVSPVGAGHKTVEGHHHLENYFSNAHIGRDLPARIDSSPSTHAQRKSSASDALGCCRYLHVAN